MRKRLSLAVFTLCAFAAHAQLETLPAVVREKLDRERFLSEAHFDETDLVLAPRSAALTAAVANLKNELKPGVIVESLALLSKGENETARWTAREKTALFNGMAALSTLAGIRYYSPSRRQTRLFYESSTIIDSPSAQKPLRDPQFSMEAIPRSLTLYAKQKDLTFGENIYRYDYSVYDNEILFFQTNLTTMYYGIIPVLGEKKLRSVITVIDSGGDLLLYMVSMASAIAIPGMKNRISLSFKARSEAILTWFTGKAQAAYSRL